MHLGARGVMTLALPWRRVDADRLFLAVCLLVPLAALVLFFLYPLATIALRSVSEPDGGFGLGNYARILGAQNFWRAAGVLGWWPVAQARFSSRHRSPHSGSGRKIRPTWPPLLKRGKRRVSCPKLAKPFLARLVLPRRPAVSPSHQGEEAPVPRTIPSRARQSGPGAE